MNNTPQTLPPALAGALDAVLQRYRRYRALRALLKILMVSLAPSAVVLGLWLASAPLSTTSLAVAWAGAIALVAAIFLWPLVRRPLTLRDVARQVDQCHPEMKDRLLSAVALGEGTERDGQSPWMLSAFFADTERKITASPLDRIVQPSDVRRVALGAGLAVLAYLLGAGVVLVASFEVREARPGPEFTANKLHEVTVEPGDVAIRPGERLVVWVTSDDTESARRLYWERGGQAGETLLDQTTTPRVAHHTFPGLSESMTYWVEVGTQASPRFNVTVNEPPAVESIQLRYTYPAYLEKEPRVVPFTGDITGVEGTTVAFEARSNKSVSDARLVFGSGEEVVLEGADQGIVWRTELVLDDSDTYHVALRDGTGMDNAYPEEFSIDVQRDRPPEIQVRQPRGDSEVLALEEVDFAFSVEDDFGVADYGIEYTIAGHDPVRIALNEDRGALREIVGNHLLELEELGVAPGDLITWAVWADDRKPDRLPYERLSDPYFLEVRPYNRRYRENVTQAGQGAAPSGPDVEQRQVVIALWNLRKSAADQSAEEFDENKTRIASAQAAVREKTEGAMGMGGGDTAIFQQALEAMAEAEKALASATLAAPEAPLTDAANHAQEAFHHLLRLAPEERQIQRAEGASQGGGGAQQEIEELELAKRKDYQEEARTGQQAVAESEALRDSLEELARRQDVLNDDISKTLAEDEQLSAEERKRRLERLKKEQQRQLDSLDELARDVNKSQMDADQRETAARNLDEARKGMESSLESVRREALQQARAAGSRAEDALSATEESLAQLTRQDGREAFDDLQENWAELAERHREMEAAREALQEDRDVPGVSDATQANEEMENYQRGKAALAEATKDALESAGDLSDRLRKEQTFLSRELGDWVRSTSRTGVVEDMMEAPQYAEYGLWDAAGMADAKVRQKLDDAKAGLEGLAERWNEDPAAGMEQALERLAALDESLNGLNGPSSPEAEGAPGDAAERRSQADQTGEGAAPSGGEAADGQPAGSTPQEGAPQDGSAPAPSENGEQAGAPSENGEQGGASREPPAEGASPGSGQQAQGDSPGGNTPGQSASAGQAPGTSSSESGESSGNGNPGEGQPQTQPSPSQSGTPTGGGRGADTGGEWGPSDDAIARGLRDGTWRREVADAAAMLPRGSAERAAVEELGLNLSRLRRAHEAAQTLPDPSEFEQVVRRPLRNAIAQLESAVEEADDESAWLEDEGLIPPVYEDRVAAYFRVLAETPETP